MKLHFFLQIIFWSCLLLSCNTQQKSENESDELISLHDSLLLEARFSECGEWGGHKEQIVIPDWKTDSASLIYHVYPFNCDSLDYYYGNDTVAPAATQIIALLDANSKREVTQYIQRLVVSKSKERLRGHANNIFSVQNSSRTLKIYLYGEEEEPVKSFRQLVSALFNDTVKGQN